MPNLIKEGLANFVKKNYLDEELGDNDQKLSEGQKKTKKKMVKYVRYFLKRSIGPNENGLITIFTERELLVINRKGDILGPS